VVWAKGSVAESAVRHDTAMDNNLYSPSWVYVSSSSLSCIAHTHSRSTLHTELLDMSLAPVYMRVPARVGVLVSPRSEKQRLSAGVRPPTPVIFPLERNSQSKLSTCNSLGYRAAWFFSFETLFYELMRLGDMQIHRRLRDRAR
jgi:hypothetical protein